MFDGTSILRLHLLALLHLPTPPPRMCCLYVRRPHAAVAEDSTPNRVVRMADACEDQQNYVCYDAQMDMQLDDIKITAQTAAAPEDKISAIDYARHDHRPTASAVQELDFAHSPLDRSARHGSAEASQATLSTMDLIKARLSLLKRPNQNWEDYHLGRRGAYQSDLVMKIWKARRGKDHPQGAAHPQSGAIR